MARVKDNKNDNAGNKGNAKEIQEESDKIWKELKEQGKSDKQAQPELEKSLLKKLGFGK
jgi:hypothetical protein